VLLAVFNKGDSMLTEKLQIQALADRIAGYRVEYPSRYFREPWLTCWNILEETDATNYRDAMRIALENRPDRKEINDAIMAAAPGVKMAFQSLEEMSASLLPIEWLWPGWLPRGMLTGTNSTSIDKKLSMLIT